MTFRKDMLKEEYVLSTIVAQCDLCGEYTSQETCIGRVNGLISSYTRCKCCGIESFSIEQLEFMRDFNKTKKELIRVADDTGNIAQVIFNLNKLL